MPQISRRQGRRLNRTGRLLLAAAALAAPLCLGGIPNWVTWLCAPLAFLALACALVGREHLKLPLFALIPLGVAAYSLFQLVPLPPALLGLLSPPAAELRDFALVPLGLTAWRPISIETDATWREVGKHLLYAVAFLAALHLSSGARGARPLIAGAIAACGALVVSLAGLHAVLGLDELYGVYKLTNDPRLLTPFGNPNHLAGFLVLTGTLSVAFALEADDRRRRTLWLAAYAVCSVGVLLSLSRAGIGAYCIAQFLLLVAIAMTRSTATPSTAVRWGAVALAVLAIIAFALFDKLSARFADTQTYASKLEIWPQASNASAEFVRTGMGRGAFEVGFTRFSTEHLGKTYTHPENVVFQLTSEMGLVPALLLLGVSVLALVQLVRGGKRTPLELAIAIAAIAVVLHNLFDFNLEYPGVALPLAVALGIAAGDAEQLWSLKVKPWPALVALAALTAFSLYRGDSSLREEEEELLAAYRSAADADDIRTAALPLIAGHPADYLPYAAVGAAYVEKDPHDPLQAIAFANRALYLYPRDFGSHQVAARALRALGRRSQALLEYRLSQASAVNTTAIIRECGAYAKSPEELLQCMPSSVFGALEIVTLGGSPHATNACVLAMKELEPEPRSGGLAVLCTRLLVGEKRLDEAIAVLDAAVKGLGDLPELAIGRADVLREQQKPDDAVAVLEAALKKAPAHFELTVALAQSYVAAKRYEAARAAVVHTTAVTTDTSRRAALKGLEGDIDAAIGELDRAVREYRAAAQLEPSAQRHYAVAGALMQQRAFDDAWAEIRAGQRLDSPGNVTPVESMFKTVEEGYRRIDSLAKQQPPP